MTQESQGLRGVGHAESFLNLLCQKRLQTECIGCRPETDAPADGCQGKFGIGAMLAYRPIENQRHSSRTPCLDWPCKQLEIVSLFIKWSVSLIQHNPIRLRLIRQHFLQVVAEIGQSFAGMIRLLFPVMPEPHLPLRQGGQRILDCSENLLCRAAQIPERIFIIRIGNRIAGAQADSGP